MAFPEHENRATPPEPDRIAATVTHLEMTRPPVLSVPEPVDFCLALMHVGDIPIHFYRYLYETTGRRYNWVERSDMDDEALAAQIKRDDVEIWVLYNAGAPAGFYELDFADPERVYLAYFGLLEGMTGRGLGTYLLSCALKRAWGEKPKKISVNTNTLDHRAALPLYQKFGFVPTGRQTVYLRRRDECIHER